MISKFSVSQLLLIETGQYLDMMSSPYHTRLDMTSLNQIQNATEGGMNLSAERLAGVASDFIMPDVTRDVVSIENGWGTRRFAFMMEVVEHYHDGTSFRKIMSGYTDHCDRSIQTKQIDPRTKFVINNITNLRDWTVPNGAGVAQTYTSVADSQQMLRPTNMVNNDIPMPTYNPMRVPDSFAMRPSDLFRNSGATSLINSVLGGSDKTTFNGSIVRGAMLSDRGNTNPSEYLSRALKAGRYAAKEAYGGIVQQGHGSGGEDASFAYNETAAGYNSEREAVNDHFISSMSRMSDLADTGFFYYQELLELDNTADAKAEVMALDHRERSISNFNQGGEAWTPWSDTNRWTYIAKNCMTMSIPFMTDLMLTEVQFAVTNETLDGSVVWSWNDKNPARSFARGMNLTSYMSHFRDKWLAQVWPAISRNGMSTVNIVVTINLFRQTIIHIRVDGSNQHSFVAPTFADQLFTPVLTLDNARLASLTSNISSLNDSFDYSS